MKFPRRPWFWLLLLLFAGACVWWLLWVPFNARRLYSAIPRTADLVSLHTAPSERWQEMLQNPLLRNLLVKEAGLLPDEIDEMSGDDEAAAMIEQLAGRELLIAHVPRLGAHGFDAWVAASWVKHGGKIIEWAASRGSIPDLQPLELGKGRKAWLLRVNEDPAAPMLGLAISHGVLLACYSRDPLALRALVERVEYGAEAHDALRHLVDTDNGPDRLWVEVRSGNGLKVHPVTVSFSEFGPRGIMAHVGARLPDIPRLSSADIREQWAFIDGTFGEAPSAVAALPIGVTEQALESAIRDEVMLAPFREFLRTVSETNAPSFLAVMSGDNAGRFLKIRVPALILGVRLRSDVSVETTLRTMLDRLNTITRWKLIPRKVSLGDGDYIIIDSAAGGIYAGIREEEKPTILVHEGWLLLGSGMEPLKKIRERTFKPTGVGLTTSPPALRRSRASAAANVAQVGQSCRNMLAVGQMILGFVDSSMRREYSPVFEQARVWLDWANYVGPTRVWVDREQEDPLVHVRIDAAP